MLVLVGLGLPASSVTTTGRRAILACPVVVAVRRVSLGRLPLTRVTRSSRLVVGLLRCTCLAVVRDGPAALEEHNDARDVVNGVLLFLPSSHRLLHNRAACAFQVIAVPEGHDHVNYLFV